MSVPIRRLQRRDEGPLRQMLSLVSEFGPEDVALELAEIYLCDPAQKDYEFLAAVSEQEEMMGFICFGPTPLTEGTFDLYWIAVHPRVAGNGIGSGLIRTFEQEVLTRCGRLILIETSSSAVYEAARRFYLKNGFQLAERIKDFYREGEDRLTYLKYMGQRFP
jgi:ribosomal protein S18 acetylase RimI-like enzyme